MSRIDDLFSLTGGAHNNAPKVFISYSWEDEQHKEWVRSLADSLLSDGINAVVDQYDLSLGERLPQFMEQAITQADYVLIICTPIYKQKSDARQGGVGYEGHIISDELFRKHNEKKFIPVIRKGTVLDSMPTCLAGKLGIDLSKGPYYDTNYEDLVTTIFDIRKKPALGMKPRFVEQKPEQHMENKETRPIQILGIITDEVTVPRMDGTRGSALYKVPFRLSETPSVLWKRLFLALWQAPPHWTLMHRPGIASVEGSKIILDGTTIEEVRDYHRETLIACVKAANEEEARRIMEEQQRIDAEKRRIAAHTNKVASIANEIEF